MYNKEEVMNGIYSACYEYLGVVFTNSRQENQEKFSNELSTALDAAYKAGREDMYSACKAACKKTYQSHKEDHLCRFNDGEQNCTCYLSGINESILAVEALK